MKKRKLCAAFALLALASFAAAEGNASLKARELPLTAAEAPSLARMGDSLLDLAFGILFGDTAYISLNVPFPIQWETGSSGAYANYSGDSSWGWSCGVGVDLTYLATQRTGFHVSASLYFPQSQSSLRGGESALGFSFFTGPALAVLRTERVLFALSPGIHVSALFSENDTYSVTRAMFGLGGNVEFALIFARLFFIRAALDITFDFVGIEQVSVSGELLSSGDTSGKVLNIVPSIGLGLWL